MRSNEAYVQNSYHVYGVGNAIVDTEVQVQDLLLATHGLEKGIMTLASADRQAALLDGLAGYARHEAAGGSAANTMVGVAQFGGKAFFSGKIGDDVPGALYRESMAQAGVEFDVEAASGSPTGTCLVLVTPDGERTMQTALGAAAELLALDVDAARIARSQIVYVEGYLFGSPAAAQAAFRTLEAARSAGVKVSLTLSDPGMAEHFIDDFRNATRNFVDLLFCNEQEARIYTGASSRDEALRKLGEDCPQVFMTCGRDGSLALVNGELVVIAGYDVPVVDTTGAGDIYAAGVLYGLTHGMDAAAAGKLGSFASARIVAQIGPRLPTALGSHIASILNDAHPTADW
jgi:sugar/nucleoside kinase (ribokinase family)